MEDNRKLNVLVLGGSGAGKSTLINAISGMDLLTDIGEGNAKKIGVYESNTWPMRLIDTIGYDHKFLEQIKTVYQIKKYLNKSVVKADKFNSGIDVVWYCIDGTTKETFEHNLKLLNRVTNKWKGVPVIVVVTKSYSKEDIEKNKKLVEDIFSKYPDINLTKIIPLVAREYKIDEMINVMPRGVEKLCLNTVDCLKDENKINENNVNRMLLKQKKFTAKSVVLEAAKSACFVGSVSSTYADAISLNPLESELFEYIYKIYGIDFTEELLNEIVNSDEIDNLAEKAIEKISKKDSTVNGVVAGGVVLASGEAVISSCEAIYTGKLEQENVNDIVEFINSNVKENSIFDSIISYFENNKKIAKDKTAKDIFKEIKKDK